MRNTREMYRKALDIYYSNSNDISPLIEMGMNENSARGTLYCYKKLLNGQLHTRNVQLVLIKTLLNSLYEKNDINGLANVIRALDKKYDFRSQNYNENNITARKIVDEYRAKLLAL